MEMDSGYITNCFIASRAGEVLFDVANGRVMLDGFAIVPLEMLLGDRLQEFNTDEKQAALQEMLNRRTETLLPDMKADKSTATV